MAKFDPDAFLGITEPVEKKKQGFDPDAFLAGPQPAARETATQTFGRSAASAADSILNLGTGIYDTATRAIARPYYTNVKGMDLEQAEQAAARSNLPKDIVGRAFGVTDTAGYQQAPLRQLGTALGETIGENVIQPVAQATGLPETYVGDVVGMLPIPGAQPAARAVAATGRGVRAAAQVPMDVATGAYGAATGNIARPGRVPTGIQSPSSRIPLKDTYVPREGMQQLRSDPNILPQDVSQPVSQMATNPMERMSMSMSGGNIPIQGQAARAFGESLGETYRSPVKAAIDIGTAAFTGIPLYTGVKSAAAAAKALGDYTLSRKGFEALTPEQRIALDQNRNPFYASQPTPPAQMPTPMPVAQPVAPTDFPRLGYNPTQPTMYVAPEGVAGTDIRAVNQAGIQQKYPPVNVGPVNPAAIQAAAAEKILPPTTPMQAAAQETVMQKAQRVMGDRYRAPKTTAPAPAPVIEAAPKATQIVAAEKIIEQIKPLDQYKPPTTTPVPETLNTPVNTSVVKGTEMTRAEKSKLTRGTNKINKLQKIENEKAIALAKEQGRIKYTLQDSDLTQTGSGNYPLKHQDAISKIEQDRLTKNKNTVWGAGEYMNAPIKWKYDPNGNSTILSLAGLKNDKINIKWDYTPDTTTQTYGKQVIVWKDGKVVKYIDQNGIDKLKELKEKGGLSDPTYWDEPTFEKNLKKISNPEQE